MHSVSIRVPPLRIRLLNFGETGVHGIEPIRGWSVGFGLSLVLVDPDDRAIHVVPNCLVDRDRVGQDDRRGFGFGSWLGRQRRRRRAFAATGRRHRRLG
jgi:hypothetical protein